MANLGVLGNPGHGWTLGSLAGKRGLQVAWEAVAAWYTTVDCKFTIMQ